MKTSHQIATALVLVLGGAIGWARLDPGAHARLDPLGLGWLAGAPKSQEQAALPSGVPVVVAQPVKLAAVADQMNAIGDGRAFRSVTLRPEVSGRVIAVPVASGALVAAGEVILSLDDEVQRIALDRAGLVRDDARTSLERIERLHASGTTNEIQLIAARLALQTAELELRDAAHALEQRTIRAPIAGHVGLLDLDIGDQVTLATDITVIDDRSRILVEFSVPERFAGRVRMGDALTATTLSVMGAEAAEGTIHAIDNRVDPASRSFRVQGEIGNTDDRFRSGMAFRIDMRFPGADLPAVPPLAVQWNAAGSYVWVVRGNTVERVTIRILQRDADRVLVEAALAPGDLVVSEGLQTLRPGQQVRIAPPDAPTTAASRVPAGTQPATQTRRADGGRDI